MPDNAEYEDSLDWGNLDAEQLKAWENTPNTARLFDSLRGSGYKFEEAMADIVDNSIAAQASIVNITLYVDPATQRTYVSIADNGIGMTKTGIHNALKYGADERADKSSLGKFGLGLKLASTAFCRRLEVISRSQSEGEVWRGILDLDGMEQAKAPVTPVVESDLFGLGLLDEVASLGSGTVIRLLKLDRLKLANYSPKARSYQDAELSKLVQTLKNHFSMVFQRFLDAEFSDVPNVKIYLNGEAIEPWDPFCLPETESPSYRKKIFLDPDDENGPWVELKAYILPRTEDFKDPVLASTSRMFTNYQGFYVYRENRLINTPVWFDGRNRDVHSNIARIDFSFSHEFDTELGLSFRKDEIHPAGEIQKMLNAFAVTVVKFANETYRKGIASSKAAKPDLHAKSNKQISDKKPVLETPTVTGAGGEETVTTNSGETSPGRLRLPKVSGGQLGELVVQETLDYNMLWTPILSKETIAVALSASHPFYRKAYLAHEADSSVIQAIDFLLWSLAQAEINNTTADNSFFEQFKIEVSRNLAKLVDNLPDPTEKDEDN